MKPIAKFSVLAVFLTAISFRGRGGRRLFRSRVSPPALAPVYSYQIVKSATGSRAVR